MNLSGRQSQSLFMTSSVPPGYLPRLQARQSDVLSFLGEALRYGESHRPEPVTVRRGNARDRFKLKPTHSTLLELQKNKWFRSRGKEKLQVFSPEQMNQLKQVFRSLDHERANFIYPEQLYQPFISLGLVTNYAELLDVVRRFDQNKNGQIEFQQFIKIAKMCYQSQQLEKVKGYFNGFIGREKDRSSFNLYFLKKRREMLMDGLRNIFDLRGGRTDVIVRTLLDFSKIEQTKRDRQQAN